MEPENDGFPSSIHETFGVDERIEKLNDMISSTSAYYPIFCIKSELLGGA